MIITASNIVTEIANLNRHTQYNYVSPTTRTRVMISRIELPEGPIYIKRFNPANGETAATAQEESISQKMICRIARAFRPNRPINFDRILGGSYNTRSAFEALLAHTPQFYWCYPGRIEEEIGQITIKGGHKHLLWLPNNPHLLGIMQRHEADYAISEIPTDEAVYEALGIPDTNLNGDLDRDLLRRHAQIQVALTMIGITLNYRVWIAANDHAITFRGQQLILYDGVINRLQNERLLTVYEEAIDVASRIDCIWFRNARLIPAVFEVEHTTGVTSGLTRMKDLKDRIPGFQTRYVIAAPDDQRQLVFREATRPQFLDLNTKYMPYSAVEELYSLCERRNPRGITDEFLDCFMENCVG